jgi:hypothetical protein
VIKANFQNVQILEKSVITISGKSCGSMSFNITLNGMQFREKQLYIIHRKKDLIVTFACATWQYESLKAELDFIQNSINLY